MRDRLEREIDRVLEERGFALVALERGGGRRRPLLRLRVERPDDPPGRSSLTAADCAAISREVLAHLEAAGLEEGDRILEVSSPGVERPLGRRSDYDRFAGSEIRVRGFGPLAAGRRQLEGRLGGTDTDAAGETVVVLEVDGETLRVPLATIARAHLVYRPEDDL
ncbi:MAG: ribosome maturation factor RimP [Gemmatimonadota bacterium]|nr:ribosome maturation factor RimP [Gemmatimonadota bacterium]